MAKEDPVGYPDFTLPVVHVGAITVEGSVSVLGTVEVKGAVTVSGTVSVSGTVEVTGAVTVSGTVSIEGPVTVTGSVTVSGTVSISGTVTVSGSVTVTGAVTVGTVAADNIIIDKLTVGAYTERRSTLENNGATALWSSPTGDARRGKFFPRGCRGFIGSIGVYCKNTGATEETITIYLSPHPSMGQVVSAVLPVAAYMGAAWRSVTFNCMWNYDSLFIFVVCSADTVQHGYDAGAPWDCFASTDGGATWTADVWRCWFRVAMRGETVGDVPVSGTINVIEIPSKTTAYEGIATDCPATQETVVASIEGAGHIVYIRVWGGHEGLGYRPYCDGVKQDDITFLEMSGRGFTASTPGLSLLQHTADAGDNWLQDMRRFEFTRKFEVRMLNPTAAARQALAIINASLLK